MPNQVLPITKPSTNKQQNNELARHLQGALNDKRVTGIVRDKMAGDKEQWIIVYD